MYKKIILSILISILLLPNILFAQTINDITLKPGFNFVSFTNLITLTPTELKALNTSIEDIFLYSPSAGSFLSASEGTLSSLSAGKGYIIKSNASSDVKISITGNAITTINPLNLKTGFNLIGFSQSPTALTFVKLMTDNSIVKGFYKWSPTAGTFIQVIRNESGVITKIDGVDPTIKAGESYFINMYADSALTYDNTAINLNPASFNTPVTPISKVATPIVTPNGVTFSSSQLITISCATEGASIYYTIDNDSATLYSAPFSISKTCTIKITASKPGWNNADLITATFTLVANPELEISGSLPASALTAPKSNINYATAIGTKGCSIAVVRSDAENTEIGTVTINSNTYKATIPITDNNYTALIIIKDYLGRVLFRNMLGKTITKSEIPNSASKIIIPNINIDANSTAMALLVNERNIEVNKITSISATDFQNGIATKTSSIPFEISQHFSSSSSLISEIAKAVNTINTSVLTSNINTNIVPANITNATELLSTFVKVIKEPTLQTIISQAQLSTSVTISESQIIDSSTSIIEPILKVKNPIFSVNSGIYPNSQQLTISCPTVGAIIKYTNDGTIPSISNGLIYNSTIVINQNTTIKAIALKPEMIDSNVETAVYTIFTRVSKPLISSNGNTFFSTLEVTIASSTLDAIIKYTIDGSTPSIDHGQNYIGPIILSASTTIKAIAAKDGMNSSEETNAIFTKIEKVATPAIIPSSGNTFSLNQIITITSATPEAFIYYTLDGSTPSLTSLKYTIPFTISTTSIIKAIAVKNGMNNSEETNAIFTKIEKVATPSIIPSSGNTFSLNQIITITSATPEASIYYTLDGSTPSLTSLKYTIPFTISTTSIIKAIAIKNGYTSSNIANETFTKLEKVATPIFTPSANDLITISCATLNATIYYTTDGTAPLPSGLHYVAPFKIYKPTTIRAVAIKNGYANSDIAISSFTCKLSPPTFIPMDSTFTSPTLVTISWGTSHETMDAEVYYTTNGTVPTIESTKYTQPILINSTATIKAIAIKNGFIDSDIATSTFTIIETVATPIINPNSNKTFTTSQQVSITCATPGASVYYTINGTVPTLSSIKYTEPFLITTTTTIHAAAFKSGMTRSNIVSLELKNMLDYFEYTDNGQGITITKCTITTGKVILPEIINAKPVTSIGNQAFYNSAGLTEITLPNSVTNIGDYSFSGCVGINSITIPSNVKTIGIGAFRNCTNLTNINIPFGVNNINDISFSGCSSLTNIFIPNSVTSIGNNTFQSCTNLTSIILPSSISTIGNSTFQNCTNLSSIILPSSVIKIGNTTFSGCTSLTNISIPNGITKIEYWTFQNCTKLKSISIPESVTSIDNSAFIGCTAITSIFIPNSVTNIGDSAFQGCTGLTSFTIPNNVVSIGESTFKGCSGLTSISIPNNVTKLGNSAFQNCTGLTSVSIFNNSSVNYYTFASCTSLTDVVINNGVNTIQMSMFYGCASLKNVTIPTSVSSIGDSAFYNCISLINITIPGYTSIGKNAFSGCTGLISVSMPNVNLINDSAFANCTNLLNFSIPNNVTNIGNSAFLGCTSIKNISIPNTITNLGTNAFYGCNSLSSIYFYGNAPSTLGQVFYNCASNFKIYYIEGKTGWTNPWNGFATETFIP